MPRRSSNLEIVEFTIEHDGKAYACERRVEGVRVMRQTIYVRRVGSKVDPANYALVGGHPLVTMPHIANSIAREIIEESQASRGDLTA